MYIKYDKYLVNLSQNHFIRLNEEDNEISFIGPNSRSSVTFLFRDYSTDDNKNKGLAKKVYDLICDCVLNPNTDYIDVNWYIEYGNLNKLFSQ